MKQKKVIFNRCLRYEHINGASTVSIALIYNHIHR